MTSEREPVTRRAWRDLGFFYDYDEARQYWLIKCDIAGGMKLVNLLRQYSTDPTKSLESEHIHLGPYGSFEIITAQAPNISDHAIEGTQQDISRLALIIEQKLADASPYDVFVIDKEFCEGNEVAIEIEIRQENFDPSSLDTYLY